MLIRGVKIFILRSISLHIKLYIAIIIISVRITLLKALILDSFNYGRTFIT